jgi:hypothetical protein
MSYVVSFLETASAPVVIIHTEPRDVLDDPTAAETRAYVGSLVGGLEVVHRACLGDHMLFGGDRHLYRYAAHEAVEVLPMVSLEPLSPRLRAVS